MRAAVILLLIAAASFAENATIIRFMNVTTSTSCPGDWLFMNATDSEGSPAPDVELRLVLYEPYQGLRALEHTGQDGLASVQLTNAGHYRLYMYTAGYNHDQYVEFDYPALCPPPPPKAMNVTAYANCTDMLLHVSVSSGGSPLPGVFVTTQDWSSMTADSGNASFPFSEGYIFINASKAGYSNPAFYYLASCAPPPECTDDSGCADGQSCLGQECINLTGSCGYPQNHTWVRYACCGDGDCGNASMCVNNTCVLRPAPPPPSPQKQNMASLPANASMQNTTSSNQTGNAQTRETGNCLGSAFILGAVLMFSRR
jgi:hypothetical protein